MSAPRRRPKSEAEKIWIAEAKRWSGASADLRAAKADEAVARWREEQFERGWDHRAEADR